MQLCEKEPGGGREDWPSSPATATQYTALEEKIMSGRRWTGHTENFIHFPLLHYAWFPFKSKALVRKRLYKSMECSQLSVFHRTSFYQHPECQSTADSFLITPISFGFTGVTSQVWPHFNRITTKIWDYRHHIHVNAIAGHQGHTIEKYIPILVVQ